MTENAKDRLYRFISHKELNPRSFELMCGLSNGFCSKVGDSIRKSKLDLISNSFPDLNTNWLLTGVGQMLKSHTPYNSGIENNITGTANDVQLHNYSNSPVRYGNSGDNSKDEKIRGLEKQIISLNQVLESKDETITSLKDMIETLKSVIESLK